MSGKDILRVFHYKKIFLSMLLIRLLCLLIVQSSFVPDEYWQSLEIAHKAAFNYGYVTWEWNYALRSFFYPFGFAVVYKILHYFEFDSVELLILLPRVIQTILSVLSDTCFVLWVYKLVKNFSVTFWVACMWAMCLFISYTSTRTLTNTVELNLTVVALYLYPWNSRTYEGSHIFVWFVGLACLARPTAAIQWVPLCIYDVLRRPDPLTYVLKAYFNRIWKVFVLSVGIDYIFYKRFVITPLNFVLYNGRYNIGVHYGVNSTFWYIYSGIPVVLGPIFVLFYCGVYKIGKSVLLNYYRAKTGNCKTFNSTINTTDSIILVTILWSLLWYSAVPHKEFRFILPLAPMMFYISTIPIFGIISNLSNQFKPFGKGNVIVTLISICMIMTNCIGLLYLGLWHQVGPLNIVSKLAKIATDDPERTHFLFLTPCHSTPLYSHIHINVKITFLTCEPNLNNLDMYKDESDKFFEAPLNWLHEHYPDADCSLPSHVILFSNLENDIKVFLNKYSYTLLDKVFHAHFTQGRQGEYINIFKLNWNKPSNCYPLI